MDSNKEENILREIRPTRRGVLVVIVLLMVFPLLIDSLLLVGRVTKIRTQHSLSGILTDHYMGLLPWFIVYLAGALIVIYFFNKLKIKL